MRDAHLAEFKGIKFFASNPIVLVDYTPGQHQAAYERGLASADSLLSSMIDDVDEYWEDEDQYPWSHAREIEPSITSAIFIVHGRDEGAKDTVARLLETLGLRPIVLAEQPGQGQTIIEKFEQHAHVAFAVIILTPDDTGSLKGKVLNIPNPRARQNVIFELGFFIGKLGRGKVCALTKGKPEIPSDYAGVEYIPIDEASDWKMKLVGELKAAGFDVDANRVFGT